MNTAFRGHASRAANARLAASSAVLLAAFFVLAIFSASASATSIKLRVEGTAGTMFNGVVETAPRSVPGGADTPYCRSNGQPVAFAGVNGLTALTDALGDAAVTTSGTYHDWGVQLCSVNGEETPASGGWLVRINNRNASAPAGYVTATDPLVEGDSILIYRTTNWGEFAQYLDLRAPTNAAPGQPLTVFVDQYADADDAKSAAGGVTITGGGASATSAGDGSATLTFPASGKFLLTATKAGALRGSAWITVDPATPATPIVRVNRFVKCNRVYRKGTKKHKRCVRIVRAKQRAAKL